jgi:hypothetical protein
MKEFYPVTLSKAIIYDTKQDMALYPRGLESP